MELKWNKIRKYFLRWGLPLLLMIAFSAAVIYLNASTPITPIVETEGRTFEKGIVRQILMDNVQEDGTRVGEQKVLVTMTTGVKKGEDVEMTSSAGYLFGAACTVGMKVIVIQSVYGDSTVSSVYSQDRGNIVIGFGILYLLGLILIGGKQGLKGAIGLLFTFLVILFFISPMAYRGFSPIAVTIFACAVTTLATMYFIGGSTRKTLIATGGTVLGCIVAALVAKLFGQAAGLSGWNVSDIESLLDLWYLNDIQVGELLFAGILISALGATMDVTMSISSAMEEIVRQKPEITRIQLFRAGMRIGSDMMGTDSNTLILAFAGTSLSTLLLNYAYQLPYLQIINSNNIGLSVMQGLSGSFGIIACVPITVLISSFVYISKG